MIDAGSQQSLALKGDGTVWAWGDNGFGQLGDGNDGVDSDTPVQVVNVGGSGYLTNIIAIAAGGNHTVALKNDGTVYAWGYNGQGQLGNDSTINSNTPVQVAGEGGSGYLTNIIAIAACGNHTIVLKNDGTLCACGNGSSGQLGDGWFGISRDWMKPVLGEGGNGTLADVDAVAAGGEHTVALKSDGTLRAWGKNDNGQLGDGNLGIDQNTPVYVTIFYTGWYY